MKRIAKRQTNDDDWFDYKLEHDPQFLERIAKARASLVDGHGVKLEDISDEPKSRQRRTKR